MLELCQGGGPGPVNDGPDLLWVGLDPSTLDDLPQDGACGDMKLTF